MPLQGAHNYQMAEDLHVPNFVLFLSLDYSVFVWSQFSTPLSLLLYFLTDYWIIASFFIPSLPPALHDKCWESQQPCYISISDISLRLCLFVNFPPSFYSFTADRILWRHIILCSIVPWKPVCLSVCLSFNDTASSAL